MSVQESHLKDIANAIRAKEGSDAPIKASEFAERIRGIRSETVYIAIIKVPSLSGALEYTGHEQTPSWNDYDPAACDLSVTPQTNAGTYSATFTPKEGYAWPDMTVGSKTISWTIEKAELPKPVLSVTSITLDENKPTETFAVTRLGDGKISAMSSDPSAVTATVSGDTVTVAYDGGVVFRSAVITIAVDEGSNYYAYTAEDAAVSVKGGVEPGIPLEDCTWAQIRAVARSGMGSEYWTVGDKKRIVFNGEIYYVQIIGFDHDDVTDASSYGRSKAGITFQFGEANDPASDGVYATKYPMSATGTNVGGWESCTMRTETMPLMKIYLPAELQDVIVAVDKRASLGGQSTAIGTTSNELWLPARAEIFSVTAAVYADEGTRYQFYREGGSARRYLSGAGVYYWSRSPDTSQSNLFWGVSANGAQSNGTAGTEQGVSFGFCV